jgi:hypothetical protein
LADDLESQKQVAFYEALVNAWITTRMERDRTLLVLSAGGIGLLVTLLTTAGPASSLELVFYVSAGVAFAAASVLLIIVFDMNGDHLREVILDGRKGDDPTLKVLDRLVFLCFVVGITLLGVIAITSGYRHMSKETTETGTRTTTVVTPDTGRSLSGVGDLGKSLSGIGNLGNAGGTSSQTGGSQTGGSGTGGSGTGSGNTGGK